MLYLDSALEIEGIVVFRDFNSPSRFYYMPRAPRLVTEGGPQFQLLIYRRDITDNPDFKAGDRPGGGFLTMTVNLEVPKATLDAVKTALASLVPGGQEVELGPVPWENGSVRISALGVSAGKAPGLEGGGAADAEGGAAVAERGPRFVERILGAARPSLYKDNAAVFTIELSHEGATLMRASLEDNGASQVAVIYDLEYKGLMPAYEAKILIETKQCYDYLHTRFTLNTLWFKSDIDAEVEKLRKEQHIKIQDVDYLGLDPAKAAERALRLEALAKELATWTFFKPGLTPGKVLADDRGNLTVYDATADAKKSEAGFTAPLSAAGTGRGSPGDVAGPRVPAESANATTTRAGGAAAPVAGAQPAAPAADAAPGAGSAVEAWNKMGRPQAGFLMRSLKQEETQLIEYDLRQVAATKRFAAPQGSIRLLPGAAQLPGRIKEVDLNDPFFERITGTVTTSADLDAVGVSSMVVKIRYGTRDDGSKPKDTQEFVLEKKDDKGTYSFFMDRGRVIDLEYQVVVNYTAGFAMGSDAVQSTSPWIPTSTRNLDVDPHLVGAAFRVGLVLGTVDWESVQSVQSTLSYESGAVRDERTVIFTKTETTKTIAVLPPPDGSRKFKVKTTFVRPTAQEVVDAADEGDATIVINPPAGRAIPVSVSLADPLARLRKVTAEMAYPPGATPEQTRLLELTGDGAAASWTFIRPADSAGMRYGFRTTEFGKDGTTRTGEWIETAERQLIVGDRFEGLLEVEVRVLVADFTSLGFMGVKLKLEYPDAPPNTKGTLEKFLTGTPEVINWRVPMGRGGSRQYRYTTQWVRTGAPIVAEGPITTSDQLLLILPPTGA